MTLPPPHPKTVNLLAREQYVQRTPEWYAVRRDLLTASDAAAALDVKPYASYRGSSRAELVSRKAGPETALNNIFVAHGQRYEDEARDWAMAALGERAYDVGLVRHATLPWLAASPDGVTASSGRLIEIKCPLKRRIEPGRVPEHYWPQVQVQMECCDVDSTLFVQYKPAGMQADRRAVLDIVVVERDREWFKTHEPALRRCWEEFMELRRLAGPQAPVEVVQPACLIVDNLYADLYADLTADLTADSPRADSPRADSPRAGSARADGSPDAAPASPVSKKPRL